MFDDHITVMNEGFWPFDSLAIEDVYNGEHPSYPANPTIDTGLFFAGAMDTWGQGFLLIKDECEKIDAPLPEIKATDKVMALLDQWDPDGRRRQGAGFMAYSYEADTIAQECL